MANPGRMNEAKSPGCAGGARTACGEHARFRGGINTYRGFDRNREVTSQFAGQLVQQQRSDEVNTSLPGFSGSLE